MCDVTQLVVMKSNTSVHVAGIMMIINDGDTNIFSINKHAMLFFKDDVFILVYLITNIQETR